MANRHRRPLPGSIEVCRQSDRRVVGEITCDGILQKHVVASKHLLRWLPGWCFDEGIISQARRAGIDLVRVIEREDKKTFWARLDDFSQHGKRFNHGHGDQVGLALKHWKTGAQPPVIAVQLGLFEGVAP